MNIIEPDAFSLAVLLATSELAEYSDDATFSKAIEIFLEGYHSFVETQFTPHEAYLNLRWLYCITNGYFNDLISDGINQFNCPYQLDYKSGVLGELDDVKISQIIQKINKDGFYVFEQKLSLDICERLNYLALVTLSQPYPSISYDQKNIYDRRKLVAPIYKFDELDIVNNHDIQSLVVDTSILALAQSYLGCKPIQDSVVMWWSTNFEKEANSKAAQLYHFDMDRIKFIKFFIYLSEVTTQNGPHCYVRGSHQSKPLELLQDRRFLDSEIEQHYSKQDIVEIIGSAGTIIAADTRGFHKGKHLQSGERLVLQIEYANSLFGAPYNQLNINQSSKKFFELKNKYKDTYCRFN
ncbi:phytanoyl-CoA dioxygenase family protein [Nostoc sp. LEGE 12450]|uniref:phytanoyl-CoA dioxygenase family protein n=1 Tax=Nostoc sp. LEGE 12450 TaxID=1828643 RepID=UPI001880D4EE|nr:phytanoyl-CoA dioxygenase family protein [Nostoc sp. LEGE 12450]MBE8985965.1 phytanoyl-CoA dioxygenase family protein [Nostoc sp. LEGE 12450]